MLLNMLEEIINYDGETKVPFVIGEGKSRPTTVRDLINVVLNTPAPGEEPLTKERSAEFYRLTIHAFSGPAVIFTVEETGMISGRIGTILNPIHYGRFTEIVERQTSLNTKDEPEE
jgi:hypothetical protein